MIIAIIGVRYESNAEGLLASGADFTASLDWAAPSLPLLADAIERPGATWRVIGRRWLRSGELQLHVEEWPAR